MKVLILTQFFDESRGGGEVVFYQIANNLAQRDHKIYVIRHRMKYEKDRFEPRGNLIIYKIEPTIEYKGGLPNTMFQNFIFMINSFKMGLKVIRKEGIEIIHTNNYTPIFSGWLLSIVTRRPLIVTIHDVALLNGLRFWRKWMKQFGKFKLIKAIIGYFCEYFSIIIPKYIHVVSETTKEDVIRVKKSRDHIYVIPNGLDVTPYIGENIYYKKEILFIGRLVFYKNLGVILKALKILKSEDIKVKLIVVGDGPMKTRWQQLAEKYGVADSVEFKGFISNKEKIKLLRRTGLLVLPSVWEGFGMVILEAWAFKKPIIVSNIEPLCNLVEHGRDGFIADPYKPQEWAKYIKLLIENEDLAKRLGTKGYRKLMEHFTIEKCTSKLEQLYDQIISIESSGKNIHRV